MSVQEHEKTYQDAEQMVSIPESEYKKLLEKSHRMDRYDQLRKQRQNRYNKKTQDKK